MAFTAESVSILNGQDVVDVNSAESIENIKAGDFLQIGSFPLVEIKQAYKNGQGQKFIQLTKAWELTTQSNQPAIVIPTSGEFRAAVKALQDANILINDNQQALQDYQNNLGTVTFKKSDGTTTTVKTLKQIEVDNQAQMNAYHPHPWAIRKAEFEAIRAANNEKYAASGFVHFGRYNESTLAGGIFPIDGNKGGLFTRTTSSTPSKNSLFLGCDRSVGSSKGTSKKDFASINITGIITELYASTDITTLYGVRVKLPQPEDGTRTYDSATGVSVTHATPAIAFASETDTNKVVTNRFDMWGFEACLREINDEDPYVYENGLIQSVANNINGVPTEDNNERPLTYFAWYKGDISTRGKGVNWQTATEAERIAIQNDRGNANQIYFDDATGKFYQWSLHGRSFAGLGNGDWNSIDSGSNVNELKFESISYSRINAQGVTNDDTAYAVDGVFIPKGNNNNFLVDSNNDPAIYYLRATTANQAKAVDGECYFLVCGTVERLNQGIAHPKNPLGSKLCQNIDTASLGQGSPWDVTDNKPLTKAECFGEKVREASGTLEYPYSGRSDGRLCDAIYASGEGGVCRDMRYPARGLKAEDFAEADLAIKEGEYRGREKLPFCVPIEVGANSVSTYISLGETKPSWWSDELLGTGPIKYLGSSKMYLYNPSTGETLYVWSSGNTASDNIGWYLRTVKTEFAGSAAGVDFHGLTGGEILILQTTADKSLSNIYVSGEYTHKEVVGEPAQIFLCDDLKDGWEGSFNGFIPDGIRQWSEVKLSNPTFDTLTTRSRTDDNGVTWSTSSFIIDPIKNTLDSTGTPPQGRVEILSYKTKAKSTIPVGNSRVHSGEVKNVWATSFYAPTWGFDLVFSTIGKILTNSVSSGLINKNFKITEYNLRPITGVMDYSSGREPKHPVINLANSNDSLGFKALNYNVAVNQQGFINYAYTELTYDAAVGDWGDDGKIHIVDNQTTMPDENGHTVLVGTARCVEPLGWLKNDK
ncbi:hypothetical protein NQS96_07650 [Pseudoalteromonas shioyasakiensis]|uniref:hypothetical protein n=1 Tax=Pseudoalteromonas shioyasakiensis TaxID=1190813 RepID=UPI002118F465|nr:hypothetical protein [Pseudoalteromonas shioyasakiensis]MCQ8881670.1 hypothetical protein [Pseudoalteromonas shioyasakiensis]